jgi:hypothetical protein
MPIKLGGLCVYMKRGGDLGWWYIDIVFFFIRHLDTTTYDALLIA